MAEAGASVLDFGIIPDSAGVQGLEAALDNAVHNGADVLITSGMSSSSGCGVSLRTQSKCVELGRMPGTVLRGTTHAAPQAERLGGTVCLAIRSAIRSAIECCGRAGGVSMGDKDFVKPLLESRGTVHFGKVCQPPLLFVHHGNHSRVWAQEHGARSNDNAVWSRHWLYMCPQLNGVPGAQVLMKPGKPLTFATIVHTDSPSGSKRLLVFGLPGNPVSSLVTFALVVLPCLRKLAGWKVRSLAATVVHSFCAACRLGVGASIPVHS